MQKVEGSSPFSRFLEVPAPTPFFAPSSSLHVPVPDRADAGLGDGSLDRGDALPVDGGDGSHPFHHSQSRPTADSLG